MFDEAITSAYRVGARLACALPGQVAASGTKGLAFAAALPHGERRVIVERNLRRVHGDRLRGRALRRKVNETFESYGRYYVESFRLPSLGVDEVDAGFTQDGFEHIERARADGHGPILVLPHLGGWEWAAFWLALVPKVPVSAVVEAIEPPSLFDWFAELRQRLGMTIIPLGPEAGSEVLAAIKRRDVTCLLSDRYLGGGGVAVEFFGERTVLPAGPATLALRTGAPIHPTAVYFDGPGRRHGICRPAIPVERRGRFRDDVARLTQDVATELEWLIGQAPEQWHLMQPNWPSDHLALGREVPAEMAAIVGAG